MSARPSSPWVDAGSQAHLRQAGRQDLRGDSLRACLRPAGPQRRTGRGLRPVLQGSGLRDRRQPCLIDAWAVPRCGTARTVFTQAVRAVLLRQVGGRRLQYGALAGADGYVGLAQRAKRGSLGTQPAQPQQPELIGPGQPGRRRTSAGPRAARRTRHRRPRVEGAEPHPARLRTDRAPADRARPRSRRRRPAPRRRPSEERRPRRPRRRHPPRSRRPPVPTDTGHRPLRPEPCPARTGPLRTPRPPPGSARPHAGWQHLVNHHPEKQG